MAYGRRAKQITSWSFTRFNDHTSCPKKAQLKHLLKVPEPKNEALAHGIEVHGDGERYLKGEITRMPASLKLAADLFRALRKRVKKDPVTIFVEDSWCFTKSWKGCSWDDWANCWLRIKVDCAVLESPKVLLVYDWKTGKFREEKAISEYAQQLSLYALGAFLRFPEVETVKPALVYLDHEPRTYEPRIYTRDELPGLIARWERAAKPMLADTIFPPRPSALCRWCHYRKDNAANGGGQCQY